MLDREPDEVRYPFLSPSELAERLARKPVLYLPTGSLEWHNEHLPLGTDTFHAIEISVRLARRMGGVALPGFWWNTGGCHEHASTYHMPESLYRAVLKCVCVGLRPIPAKVLVLVNGHGGGYQKDTPPLVAQELNREGFPMRVVVADVCNMAQSSPCHIDHADIGETSIALELIPQLVRMERPVGPDLFSGRKPFAQGQPSKAGGRMWWEAFLDDAEAVIGEALSS